MHRRATLWLAGANLLVAGLLLGGIWAALPARWLPVDLGGSLLAGALGLAGLGLASGRAWGRRCAVAVSGVCLALGLGVCGLLCGSAAYLAGLYGPVGQGGMLLLAAVALLLLPYLVVFPFAQLLCLLGPRRHASAAVADEP